MNLKEIKLYEDTTASNIASVATPLGAGKGKGRIVKRGDRKYKQKFFETDEDFFNFLIEAKDENLNTLYNLLKNGKNGWSIELRPSFKKKLRKYSNEKTVIKSLVDILLFITSHNKKPSSHEYPPELYVHNLVKGKHAGKTWSHLKGQKIGLMFHVSDKTITLIDMGTHQDFGWK